MATPVAWSPEFLVSTTTSGKQTESSVALLADGRFVVVWSDFSFSADDTQGIRGQVFSVTGARIGGEFLVNTTTVASQAKPAVTGLANGGFVVTWEDFSGSDGDTSNLAIRARVFARGAATPDQFRVNDETLLSQSEPAIARLATGGFVVAWTDWGGSGGDGSQQAVKAKVFDAGGVEVGDEFLVNTTTALIQNEATVAALGDGRFVVVWTDQSATGGDTSRSSVRAQVFESGGTKVGGEILVNTTTAGTQRDPAVAVLSDGRFAVAFQDESGTAGPNSLLSVRVRVFDPDGTPSGDEFLAATTLPTSQSAPAIAALSDGRMVIVWADQSGLFGDTSARAIVAQVFDAEGTASGEPFRINDATVSEQFDPSVAALLDGRFVVSWTDNSRTGGDTSEDAIRAQVFDPREGRFVFRGGPADESVAGTRFGDLLFGSAGDDAFSGAAGADRLDGGGGGDELSGDSGNDTLRGKGQDDRLAGGAGRDLIDGGAGNDTLHGGAQSDIFVFADGFGQDVIRDFAAADAEVIDLSAVTAIRSFADLVANHLETDAATGFARIVAGTNTILLEGVTVAEIGPREPYSAADFLV